MKDFKPGDVVWHKSTKLFKMVIIKNGIYPSDTFPKENVGKTNPNSFLCRYYVSDKNEWAEKVFNAFELVEAN